MTTATAGQEKEKVEKRRALGRGLDSLLPGPRVVVNPPARDAGTSAASSAETGKDPAPPSQGSGSGVQASGSSQVSGKERREPGAPGNFR